MFDSCLFLSSLSSLRIIDSSTSVVRQEPNSSHMKIVITKRIIPKEKFLFSTSSNNHFVCLLCKLKLSSLYKCVPGTGNYV